MQIVNININPHIWGEVQVASTQTLNSYYQNNPVIAMSRIQPEKIVSVTCFKHKLYPIKLASPIQG